jgi:chromosomal replication initiator protein
MTSQELWQRALDELRLQMTEARYNTWLRDTRIAQVANGQVVIAAPDLRAPEWLKHQFSSVICGSLADLLDSSVSVEFQVVGGDQ